MRPVHPKYRKYCSKWEQIEMFRDWLMPFREDPCMAYCKYCKKPLRAHKNDLFRHTQTEKHKKKFEKYQQKLEKLSQNWTSTCFVCLERSDALLSIFNEKYQDILLIDIISECADIKIPFNINCPREICTNCYDKLKIAYDFRQLCKNSYNSFQTYIKSEDEDDFDYTEIKIEKTNDFEEDNEYCDEDGENIVGTFIDYDSYLTNDVYESDTEGENKKRPKTQQKQNDIIIEEPSLKLCELCGNKFQSQHILDNHIKRHLNDKKYKCDFCSKAYVVKCELDRHMRVHTGEKPYSCQYCHRKFSDYGSRTKHERTHTGERPYKCNTCEKSFTTTGCLRRHELTHSEQKSFICSICEKGFTRKESLKSHLQVHAKIVQEIEPIIT